MLAHVTWRTADCARQYYRHLDVANPHTTLYYVCISPQMHVFKCSSNAKGAKSVTIRCSCPWTDDSVLISVCSACNTNYWCGVRTMCPHQCFVSLPITNTTQQQIIVGDRNPRPENNGCQVQQTHMGAASLNCKYMIATKVGRNRCGLMTCTAL